MFAARVFIFCHTTGDRRRHGCNNRPWCRLASHCFSLLPRGCERSCSPTDYHAVLMEPQLCGEHLGKCCGIDNVQFQANAYRLEIGLNGAAPDVFSSATSSTPTPQCSPQTSISFSQPTPAVLPEAEATLFSPICSNQTSLLTAPQTCRFGEENGRPPPPAPSHNASFNISEVTWWRPWGEMHQAYAKHSGFTLRQSGIGFADGQYVGARNNLKNSTLHSLLYCSRKDPDVNNAASFIQYMHDREDGQLVSVETGRTQYTATHRKWYLETPQTKGSTRWTDVFFSEVLSAPIITYSKAIHLYSGIFAGIVSFALDIEGLDTDFKRMVSPNDHPSVSAFLIGNDDRIIASSSTSSLISTIPIPEDYVLTPSEKARGCARSVNGPFSLREGSSGVELVCLHGIASFGNAVLKGAFDARRDLFDTAETRTDKNITTVSVGGDDYFVMVSTFPSLGTLASNNMHLRSCVMLRVDDARAPARNGLIYGCAVLAPIVMVFGVLVAISMHRLAKPLAIVAQHMRTSAFLSSDGDEAAAAAELRIPSYLSEVATIQRSYWAMSDELKLLKAYIPEHLLTEVLSQRRRTPNPERSQTMSPVRFKR